MTGLTRQERKADTRMRIIKTAADMLQENGLDGLKTSQLAKAAGVAEGTIFSHFGNMEGVLFEVYKLEVQITLQQAAQSMRESTELWEGLERYTRVIIEYYSQGTGPLIKRILFTEGEVSDQIRAQVRELIGYVDIFLQGQRDKKALKAEANCFRLAHIYYSITLAHLIVGLRMETFPKEDLIEHILFDFRIVMEGQMA